MLYQSRKEAGCEVDSITVDSVTKQNSIISDVVKSRNTRSKVIESSIHGPGLTRAGYLFIESGLLPAIYFYNADVEMHTPTLNVLLSFSQNFVEHEWKENATLNQDLIKIKT